MLKQLSSLSICVLLFLTPWSCRKASVDYSLGRTNEAMRKFAQILADAENGWNVCIIRWKK